ncbi:excisionase family DNA-binding protein [Candidatus Gracilibacteria bacterium]|nr:excisionase family DNA-binding protein [Candidatus Gracilibacteria bacterium]
MYKLTRKEAADLLNISTRSVDRYIKSGKIRTKKDGKVVCVNEEDISRLKNNGDSIQEVILPSKKENNTNNDSDFVTDYIPSDSKSLSVLDNIYDDLKKEIIKKDSVIQDLSIKLGRAEEMAKNSISLIEFKKSQFLLEEGKEFLSQEITDLKTEKNRLLKDLNYEKSTNSILMIFILVLITLGIIIWFANI